MNFPAEIVVRKMDGRHSAGFAKHHKLCDGWEHVQSFGKWCGSQMSFRPFKKAFKEAGELAETLNNKEKS